MHSQIKLLTSLTQFGEECWSLATVYANTWINSIWLQTGSIKRSRMTFCVGQWTRHSCKLLISLPKLWGKLHVCRTRGHFITAFQPRSHLK